MCHTKKFILAKFLTLTLSFIKQGNTGNETRKRYSGGEKKGKTWFGKRMGKSDRVSYGRRGG